MEALRADHGDEAVGAFYTELLVEGTACGVHGPIIGQVPGREEALAIWDAVVPLARGDTFFELKRGRS